MLVVLTIYSSRESRQVEMTTARFVIGRDSSANVKLGDQGVSSLHASIHREGDRVWILDEGSANGTYVNGVLVPPVGIALSDGAELTLGNETSIVVTFQHDYAPEISNDPVPEQQAPPAAAVMPAAPGAHPSLPIPLIAGLFAAVIVLVGVVVFATYALNRE